MNFDEMVSTLSSDKSFILYHSEMSKLTDSVQEKKIKMRKNIDISSTRNKVLASKSEEEIIANLNLAVDNPILLLDHTKLCAKYVSETINENNWLSGLTSDTQMKVILASLKKLEIQKMCLGGR